MLPQPATFITAGPTRRNPGWHSSAELITVGNRWNTWMAIKPFTWLTISKPGWQPIANPDGNIIGRAISWLAVE